MLCCLSRVALLTSKIFIKYGTGHVFFNIQMVRIFLN